MIVVLRGRGVSTPGTIRVGVVLLLQNDVFIL